MSRKSKTKSNWYVPNLDSAKPKKKALLSDEDRALWEGLKAQIQPLKQKQSLIPSVEPKSEEPTISKSELNSGSAHIDRRRAYRPLPPVFPTAALKKPNDYLGHGDAPGLDKRKKRRLQRGKLEVEARLDLHGMTQETAQNAVSGFVNRCYEQGKRSLIIVSGKGLNKESGGILRSRLPDWLNMQPIRNKILSFDYAQPKDGGTGAIYLLLKKKR